MSKEFDNLSVKEGRIIMIVSITLSAFFEKKIEGKFFKVRYNKKWCDFVKFNGELHEKIEKHGAELLTYDEDERKLEKELYDIEAFRGIVFNDLFTPVYKVKKDAISGKIEKIFGKKIMAEHKYEIDKITHMLKVIDHIKIRITQDGLANIIFEKEVNSHPTRRFACVGCEFTKKDNQGFIDLKDIIEQIIDFLSSPYKQDGTKTEVRNLTEDLKQQIFSSNLYLVAIWIISIFLRVKKHCIVEKVVKNILNESMKKPDKHLKNPWNVCYKSIASFADEAPPIRNYCVFYYFKGLQGEVDGKTIDIKNHFACPDNINECENDDIKECFIKKFGHSLLSLSESFYTIKNVNMEKNKEKMIFSQKAIEDIAKRNLSRHVGELCLIDSEAVIIATSTDITKLSISGDEIEYDRYWKSIIRGFTLLLNCKTLLQITGRLLFECMYDEKKKKKDLDRIEDLKRYRMN